MGYYVSSFSNLLKCNNSGQTLGDGGAALSITSTTHSTQVSLLILEPIVLAAFYFAFLTPAWYLLSLCECSSWHPMQPSSLARMTIRRSAWYIVMLHRTDVPETQTGARKISKDSL